MVDLSGKTALVTGSTSGIGLGIARGMARSGASLMLNGLGDAGEMEAIRSALALEHGVQVGLSNADMSDPDQIAALSVHGLVASVEKVAYVAAKHGLVGLTKVVALESAASGITCNAICPGFVLTPLVQAQIDDRARRDGITEAQAREAMLAEKQPSLGFATPDQIAELALFLCSEAAQQITGASLPVDGGWTAR